MPDHRDMRYFLPGVALAAVAFAWLLEQAGPRASPVRVLLLLVLTFHVARKLDLGGTVAMAVALALIGLGWLAVRHGPRWAAALARPSPRRWLEAGAWMVGRPRAFRLEYFDPATEIWRVVPEEERARPRDAEGSPAPGTGGEGTAPTPGRGSGSNSSG